MTHVAFVIESMGSGGAQRVLSEVAGHLVDIGHTVSVITFAGVATDRIALPPAVARLTLPAPPRQQGLLGAMTANLRLVLALRQQLKTCPATVLVGMVGTTNTLLLLAAAGLGRRVIISERNDINRQRIPLPWALLRRILYRHADLATANSQAALDAMARFVPRSRLRLLPNPVRQTESGLAVIPKTSPVILAVGRLHPQKAYDILLAAFAAFHATHENWKLVVLGEGALRVELEDLTARLGLQDSVAWAGHQPDPFPWYRMADIFVLASRYEGSPNALLEAMSCGMPPVVTDALPGALEHVHDNVSGIVVPVDNVPALTAALGRLADDQALRQRIGAAARGMPSLDRTAALGEWTRALAERTASSAPISGE